MYKKCVCMPCACKVHICTVHVHFVHGVHINSIVHVGVRYIVYDCNVNVLHVYLHYHNICKSFKLVSFARHSFSCVCILPSVSVPSL